MAGISRRALLQGTGLAAGGLVAGCVIGTGKSWVTLASEGTFDGAAFDAWLQITPDDRIILQLDKVEMGQGTSTGLATLLAEELEVEAERIEVHHAPVHEQFQDPLQVTGGSTSIRTRFDPLRRTGAQARERMKRVAAERWGVSPERLVAENGRIRDPSTDRSFRYGELADDAARIPAPDVMLKSPSEFKQIGRSFPRLDAEAKATGRAKFGIDAQVPGLLTAVVVHSPHRRGALVSFDDAKARALPGVEDVFEISTGVAVVATSYWRARKGANALEVTWDPGESRGVSSDFIRREQKRRLDEESGKTVRDDGDVADAFEAAAKVVEAEYYAPYLAHATMEPMNCTVVPGEGRCDVYLGTQAPQIAQEWVARNMDCPREEVFVHNAFLGGGFGRRGFSDYAGEAAEIAKRTGKPIKLVWSREDDMTQDYYRPASSHRLRAGFDEDGHVTAWEHRLVIPAIFPYLTDGSIGTFAPEWLRGVANSVGQGVVNLAVRYMDDRLPARAGSLAAAASRPRAGAKLWCRGTG